MHATDQQSESQRGRRLIPLTKWNEYHEWPPLGGLRHLVFHAATNGFERVIRRVGRRVLLDEAEFFRWVESQNGSASTDTRVTTPR